MPLTGVSYIDNFSLGMVSGVAALVGSSSLSGTLKSAIIGVSYIDNFMMNEANMIYIAQANLVGSFALAGSLTLVESSVTSSNLVSQSNLNAKAKNMCHGHAFISGDPELGGSSMLLATGSVTYDAAATILSTSTFAGNITVSAQANLVSESALSGTIISVNYVYGSSTLNIISILITVGIAIRNAGGNFGSGSGVSGVATVTTPVPSPSAKCDKPPLPFEPQPSTADYSPQNVAPLIKFFRPIVSGVLGKNITLCEMKFRYENNTPCYKKDDIFVRYPTCIPVPYTPTPPPTAKSQALLTYEAYAKKSDRLYSYMINSPARIKYFDGDMDYQNLPY